MGYVGIGLDGLNSVSTITEACTTGREEECKETKYTESGRFLGSLGGGYAGTMGGFAACSAVLGIETMGLGVIGCGIVAVGTGALGGKTTGSAFEKIGRFIFNIVE